MSVHIHNTIPIRVWWRKKWICIHQGGTGCEYVFYTGCEYVFYQDVTGTLSSNKGDLAYFQDTLGRVAQGTKLRSWHLWWWHL